MSNYEDDDSRWAAVQARDPAADRAFVYGVRTTKIYCRPICKARLARRSNVTFYQNPQEAQDAGFRACKRCKPELPTGMPEEDAVRKIREFVAEAPTDVELSTLNAMAKYTGLSKWHFHRVFKKVVGMTPNEYTTARRLGTATPQASSSHQSPDTLPELGMSTSTSVTTPSSSDMRTSESNWDTLDWLGQHDPEWFNFDPMNAPGYAFG
jgi:methylphosphotriester-DNA--protein-cysteine methyltransferase